MPTGAYGAATGTFTVVANLSIVSLNTSLMINSIMPGHPLYSSLSCF